MKNGASQKPPAPMRRDGYFDKVAVDGLPGQRPSYAGGYRSPMISMTAHNFEPLYARSRDNGQNGDRRYGEIVTDRRTQEKTKTKKPPLYKCGLLNHAYTPMHFFAQFLQPPFPNH